MFSLASVASPSASVVTGPTCTSKEPYSIKSDPVVSSSSRALDPDMTLVAEGAVMVMAAIRTTARAGPID